MNSKTWLTVFSVIAVLVIGGSGFFCFSASKKFSEAKSSWNEKTGVIGSLERKPLYPSKEHVDNLKQITEDYKNSVDELFNSLNKFQKPLNTELSDIDFPDKVKKMVTEFRKTAESSGFSIEQDDLFQLGFNAYANSAPTPDIVPILDYELQSIDHLLRKIISSGAESMTSFSRDLIPGEVGGPAKQENSVVHKYPVRLGIRSSHKGFQNFMNSISNDPDFFYMVRILEVNNEAQDGPYKNNGELYEVQTFQNELTGIPASPDQLFEWGSGTASALEVAAAAKEEGYIASGRDARVLMGQEKLDVFMVIDLVRFLDPAEVEMRSKLEKPARARSKGKKRR